MKRIKKTILLVSTSHNISDDMIYYRYAKSFEELFERVVVIGIEDNVVHDDKMINCFSLPRTNKTRVKRFFINTQIIYHQIKTYKPTSSMIVFFTPDLIPIMQKLISKRYQIIQVFVENYPLKILYKQWIPKVVRKPISRIINDKQISISINCFANIFVDQYTMDLQGNSAHNKILLPNYPISLSNVDNKKEKEFDLPIKIVYSGGINNIRGFHFMQEIIQYFDVNEIELNLYGKYDDDNEKEFLEWINGTKNVKYHGYLPYNEVLEAMHYYDVGLALYSKIPAFYYIAENTTKIFDYMEFGLPIVAQSLPGLKRIIEDEDHAGKCFDTDKDCWLDELKKMLYNKKELSQMSHAGKKAFEIRRNWNSCKKQLTSLFITNKQ